MKNSTKQTNEVQHLLREAAKGNAKAAYLAGRAFEELGYRPYFVQAQYRYAAELGYPLAQRWLGILGLCLQLLPANGSFSDERCNEDPAEAIFWLRKAADNGDKPARLILIRCKRYGIGMEANPQEAKHEEAEFLPLLEAEQVAAVKLLFQSLHSAKANIIPLLRSTPLYELAS